MRIKQPRNPIGCSAHWIESVAETKIISGLSFVAIFWFFSFSFQKPAPAMSILGLNTWVGTVTTVLALVNIFIVIGPGVHHAQESLLTFLESAVPIAPRVSREIQQLRLREPCIVNHENTLLLLNLKSPTLKPKGVVIADISTFLSYRINVGGTFIKTIIKKIYISLKQPLSVKIPFKKFKVQQYMM